MLGASAPPVSDSPPDAAAQSGVASYSPSLSDEGLGDGRGGDSSSDDSEQLEIVVRHNDTKSSPEGWSPASDRSGGSAETRVRARKWTDNEVEQVKKRGREIRGSKLGEAGFEELAQQLRRTTASVYGKWMKIQTPKKRRLRRSSGAKGRAQPKILRRNVVVEKSSSSSDDEDEVEEESDVAWQSSNVAQLQMTLWQSQLEVAGLRAQVFTLRECLQLLGMRGIARGGGAEARRS